MNGPGRPHAVLALLLIPALVAGVYALQGTGRDAGRAQPEDDGPLDRALPLFPNVSFATETPAAEDFYELGFALSGEERYGEALEVYDRALLYNASHLNAWYYRGDALARLGRYGEAVLSFRNATAVDPDFVDAYFYESLVLGKLGRSREQEEALRKGLDAAERVKAAGGAQAPAQAPGPLSQPLSPGAAIIGIGVTGGLMAVMQRKKR